MDVFPTYEYNTTLIQIIYAYNDIMLCIYIYIYIIYLYIMYVAYIIFIYMY